MKKIILISFIFILILITSFIKNSTKKIEDEIYNTNENLRSLNTKLGDVQLEYNYLTSPEKLLQYQLEYFDNTLVQRNIKSIKKINEKENKILITEFNKNNE